MSVEVHTFNYEVPQNGCIEAKSKFDAEFRRFGLDPRKLDTFEELYIFLERLHSLNDIPFSVCYTDPQGDLLPINNDDNYHKAITTAKPLLRIHVSRTGEGFDGYGTVAKKRNRLSTYMVNPPKKSSVKISLPEDFRRVSAIIDVDIVPESHRRVRLHKHGSEKPLGFYIRDGTSVRVTPHGLEKVPGIFISRLVPGGLAEGTGLLAVNDEVLEVNGIEVAGKTLDQVTDMMVANSSNLIITVKPVNQRNNLTPRRTRRGSLDRNSTISGGSGPSTHDSTVNSDEEDIIQDVAENVIKTDEDSAVYTL
ncbi:Par-6-like protein [Saccoglossus kowalevskii]|uniref:Par-6-like protein n=1 Tax=Saccoglossus kowalevskii TaxID=10224 RepID=D1LXB0_SACKO|nr:Par-6-like protein [Saccoglossus kowalevskii]ACY92616.1 Par-6-like protein [Saccoglossus kowalevskii]